MANVRRGPRQLKFICHDVSTRPKRISSINERRAYRNYITPLYFAILVHAARSTNARGIVTHVLVRRLNGSLCRENRSAWSPKRATWSCGRLRVHQHKGWSWIQWIPCARRISSHSHGNPIARLYASLALETELTPLNPGRSVRPRYYSHLCRPFVRSFV